MNSTRCLRRSATSSSCEVGVPFRAPLPRNCASTAQIARKDISGRSRPAGTRGASPGFQSWVGGLGGSHRQDLVLNPSGGRSDNVELGSPDLRPGTALMLEPANSRLTNHWYAITAPAELPPADSPFLAASCTRVQCVAQCDCGPAPCVSVCQTTIYGPAGNAAVSPALANCPAGFL